LPVAKFASEDRGWLEHRWVRFNRLLISLRQQIEGLTFAAGLDRYARPLDVRIDESFSVAPLRGRSVGPRAASERSLDREQVDELRRLLAALRKLESMYENAGDYKPYVAVPRPSLRVRHPT
jgi:hypothetical protein